MNKGRISWDWKRKPKTHLPFLFANCWFGEIHIVDTVFESPLPSGKLTWPMKMTIEIVSFPMKNGDFPCFFVSLPEGKSH